MNQTRLAVMFLAIVMFGGPSAPAQTSKTGNDEVRLQAAIHTEMVDGNVKSAIEQYQKVAQSSNRALAARALIRMAECYQKLGDTESKKIYERVLRDYSDQKEAVAAAHARLGDGANRPDTGIVAKQLWSWIGTDVEARAISPDGRYLAWIDWKAGGSLALRDLTSGESRLATNTPWASGKPGGYADAAVFTPDGKQILYVWYQDDAAGAWQWQLRMINTDGSNLRIILRENTNLGAISPDGKLASIRLSRNGTRQLAIVELASGNVRVLKSLEWRGADIGNFTPDSRYFVYSLPRNRDSQDQDVFAIAVDGSSESMLVSSPGANRGPFVSPDGSNVVFSSNRSGRWDLWTVGLAAGKAASAPKLLKTDVGAVTPMGFARDGNFYYRQTIVEEDGYLANFDLTDGVVKGEPKRVSERFIGNSAAPSWSPDGKWLAYIAHRSHSVQTDQGEATLIVRSTESLKEREFTVPFRVVTLARFFRWFPDSKSLLLPEYAPQARRFRKLDIDTGQLTTMFEIPRQNAALSTFFSADGGALFYSNLENPDQAERTAHLLRRDLQSGEEKSLLTMKTRGAGLYGLTKSPDGKWIAFIPDNRSVWIAPITGGEPKQLWRTSTTSLPGGGGMTWTSDGRGILVTAAKGEEKGELLYIPVNGGEPRSTGIAGGAPQMHPNDELIAFHTGRASGQVWALKNLLSVSR